MKLKILRVVPDFLHEKAAYGFFINFLFLSIQQKNLGHEVLVLCPGNVNAIDDVGGIRVVRIRRNKFFPFVPFQLNLAKIIKQLYVKDQDYTLVHSHSRTALGISYVKSRPPHVVHLHGLPFAAFEDFRQLSPPTFRSFLYDLRVHHLYKIALKRAEFVISCNKGLALLLPRTYGVPKEKIFVVPNGVEDVFLDPMKGKERHSISKDSEDKTILFVGRLAPVKGVYQTIFAMPQILQEHPSARLLLIGSGDKTNTKIVHQIISTLGIRENVTLIDHVPHRLLPDYYLNSCVHVAPQLSGVGYPKSILESLACGTPVVTLGNIDTEEIVSAHHCGFVVDPKDPKDIASNVNYLLSNPDEAKKMGRNGYNLVKQNFTWRKCAYRLDQVYERIFNS